MNDSNNTLAEIEAALSKELSRHALRGKRCCATVHVLGFPTKYTKGLLCTKLTFDGPFFADNGQMRQPTQCRWKCENMGC